MTLIQLIQELAYKLGDDGRKATNPVIVSIVGAGNTWRFDAEVHRVYLSENNLIVIEAEEEV